jgi:hypothetical protein
LDHVCQIVVPILRHTVARPASTKATVYGSRVRRASIATREMRSRRETKVK